jgi:hypothetical protein
MPLRVRLRAVWNVHEAIAGGRCRTTGANAVVSSASVRTGCRSGDTNGHRSGAAERTRQSLRGEVTGPGAIGRNDRKERGRLGTPGAVAAENRPEGRHLVRREVTS